MMMVIKVICVKNFYGGLLSENVVLGVSTFSLEYLKVCSNHLGLLIDVKGDKGLSSLQV